MQKDFLLNEGIAAAKQKDFTRAHQLLRDALKLDQNNVEGWIWYARIQGDPEMRQRCIERALSIDPTHPDALRMQSQLKNAAQRKTTTMRAITQTSTLRAITDQQIAEDSKRRTGEFKRKTSTTGRVPKDLGQVLAHSKLNLTGLASRGLVVLVLGLFAVWVLLVSDFINAVQSLDSLDAIRANPLPVILVGASLIGLPIAAWNLARLLLALPRGVAVKDYGIEIFGLGVTKFTYRDIETVRLRHTRTILRRVQYQLEIETLNGKRLVVNQTFSNAHEVIEAILHRTGPILGQQLGKLIVHGSELGFENERVTVDREGIRRGPKLIAWADIQAVVVNRKGRVVVDSSYQGTIDILVDNDDNLPLLGYIARYISARQIGIQYNF